MSDEKSHLSREANKNTGQKKVYVTIYRQNQYCIYKYETDANKFTFEKVN